MTVPTLPRILALAPGGLGGIGVVAAASRASALGIVDLCLDFDQESARAFPQISRLTGAPFGVRVEANDVLRSSWLDDEGHLPDVVCVPMRPGDLPSFERAVRAIQKTGRVGLAEVTSKVEVRRAIAGGVAGLIVAGNEAGGWGGAESAFVLMQVALAEGQTPVWVRGGIGPHVAAGCVAAGAAGVVLDGALLLARESPLGPDWRERIARWDGSETTVIAPRAATGMRVFALPGSEALTALRRAATDGGASGRRLFASTSAGGPASACPSAPMRRWRIGLLASM